jgi:hypothetical protein
MMPPIELPSRLVDAWIERRLKSVLTWKERLPKHSAGEVRPTSKPAPLAEPCPPPVTSPRSRRLPSKTEEQAS